MADRPKVEFVIPGEHLPGQPFLPQSSKDIRERMAYDPNFLNLVELSKTLPKIEFAKLGLNDLILMRTEEEAPFGFLVDKIETKKHPSIKGKLFLPFNAVQLLGGPGIIQDTEIRGATPAGGTSLFLGRIIKGMGVECYLPLTSLGPIINEAEKEISLKFLIPPLEAAGVRGLKSLPGPTQENIRRATKEPESSREAQTIQTKVNNWPGKETGIITLENIEETLYLAPGLLGLKGRYWVNPETGAISKYGQPMEDVTTVWKVVSDYLGRYNATGKRFHAKRVAAFTYWALKLNLQPPPGLVKSLKKSKLGF